MEKKLITSRTGLQNNLAEHLHQKLDSLVASLLEHEIDLDYARKQLDRAYISAVLRAHQGNIGQSARALGVHRNTLSKRIKELEIKISKTREAP